MHTSFFKNVFLFCLLSFPFFSFAQNISINTTVLIEAIKEQQLIIEQLKKENSKKQAEIDEVVSRVSKLEALLGTFSEKK